MLGLFNYMKANDSIQIYIENDLNPYENIEVLCQVEVRKSKQPNDFVLI